MADVTTNGMDAEHVASSGVINHYVGGGPISRTAAVIAPGAVVMAMIYA